MIEIVDQVSGEFREFSEWMMFCGKCINHLNEDSISVATQRQGRGLDPISYKSHYTVGAERKETPTHSNPNSYFL